MSNHIVEENPSAQPATSGADQGADQKVRKQARQLAYDVRYKVKQGFKEGQKADPVSLKRAYLSQLGKSPAPGPVKAVAKKMLVGESYDFVDITDTVKSSVSDVLNSVFTLGGGKKEEEIVEADLNKKFKVRVKDKKTGRSYVRMADRAKISELRKNPNIASVEMTGGAGTPYEGEKKKGAATASVKAGKGIPGDVEKVKEEFIAEVGEGANPESNTKKIDVMKGKNKVTINPTQSEQVEPDKEEKPKMDPKEKRVAIAKRMILQKKMQAVRSGAGADIVAHTELEGEVLDERLGGKGVSRKAAASSIYPGKKGDGDYPDSDRGAGNKAKKRAGGTVEKKSPTYLAHVHNKEEVQVEEKKAKKDYDGDGKIESGKDEYFGSRDKAIKKAMAKKGVKESTNRLGLKSWQSAMFEGTYGEIDRPVEKKDDTPSAKVDVTFDAGAAIPTTINGTGDPRELPTAINLVKNKLRAQGIMASKEPEGELVEGKKKGLWDNIHAKRKRGEKPAKPGDEDYPKTLNVESLKQARKNVGADKCWDGYKAKGTKDKGGKKVPNCVKEEGIDEGMATPESGTGKYYNEKKPTAMQLAKRKKMEKVKSLTNQGKHKEASALYKEGIDLIKGILENRQVAMNPEKHKDPDESDKPYAKRSKAARMRDPKRGINSPAFKKFMADRGM